MRKLLPLLICLSLSIFTVARAMRPTQVFSPEPDATALANDASTEEEEPSHDDDSTPGASNDDGDDANDNDGDDAAGHEGAGSGSDNGTAPDDAGDEDGDDGDCSDQGK
jgi:hypothetical protein